MGNNKTKFFLFFLFFLLLANFYIWKFIFSLNGNLKVVFFDVGQGDSIFVETPRRHQILIDGGPSGEIILEKLAKELPFWDRSLDLVILTHPEKDHLAGLLSVLERYEIENVLWNGVQRETEVFEKWQEAIKKEKANVKIAQSGQEIKGGGAEIYILHPFENLEGKVLKNTNDTSIVLELLFGGVNFFFTGDITQSVEKSFLEKGFEIDSDVLKVAHHGSKTSSNEEFLEKVSPAIAVISCGENNPYQHPHEEVLRKLQDFDIKILRTDEVGDIKIISDGISYQIK